MIPNQRNGADASVKERYQLAWGKAEFFIFSGVTESAGRLDIEPNRAQRSCMPIKKINKA